MANVREYNNKQQLLFPPSIGDFIEEDDAIHIIDEVVESIDLKEYYEDIPEVGNPSYDPKMMIKIIFAGYYYGVYSSRKIMERVRKDVGFIYLAGMQKPDFRTISDFRKKNIGKIKKSFVEILKICKGLGMINLEEVAIDSKVMKANASNREGYTEDELKEEMEEIEEEIKGYLEKGVEVDEEEDRKYGKDKSGKEVPEGIRKKEKRLEKIKEAIKKIKEEKDKGKTTKAEENVNLTDIDGKQQNNKGKIEYGYRGQVIVDGKNQVILEAEVVAEQNDTKQLIPMVEGLKRNMEEIGWERKGKKINFLGDCGYGTVRNLKEIRERGYDKEINFYIPDRIMEQEKGGKGGSNKEDIRFDKSKFIYDKKRDKYKCPGGKELKKERGSYSRGVKRWIYRVEGGCKGCEYYGKCTTNKRGRIITRLEGQELIDEMRKKLRSKKGKEIYRRRKGIVEPVIGNMSYNMGFTEFLLRGIRKVRGEFTLVAIAHNLKKIANYIKEQFKTIRNIISNRGIIYNTS